MNIKSNKGLSLVEVLVTIGVLSLIIVFILLIFQNSLRSLNSSKCRILATALANEKMEILRSIAYDQLGTQHGWPLGNIPDTETVTRSGIEFAVSTRIDYIDDPFDGDADGTIEGKPRDTVPSDYKKCDVTIDWKNNFFSKPIRLSTHIVPSGLESGSGMGSLLIKVFDASGKPVPQATVTITNNQVVPNINIVNTTDLVGNLQVLSLPPSLDSYHIVVTKNGYSTDSTYPISLPNPVQPDLSIIAENVTYTSFAIDKVSSLSVDTYNQSCQPLPNISFKLQGAKLVGTSIDQYKYSQDHQTDASGHVSVSNLEWDLYDLLINTPGYDISGINHDLAMDVLPNTSTELSMMLASHTNNSLLVTVKDAGTDITLADANVNLTKTGYDETKITGKGFIVQADWSGGEGQIDFTDPTKYFSDDNNIENNETTGQVSLLKNTQNLNFSESFDNNSNKDESNTTADWDLIAAELKLPKNGSDYQASAYAQTKKMNLNHGKITKATINANHNLNGQSVNYLLSADGGLHFEPVTLGTEHQFLNIGSDLRTRIELSTTDISQTPVIYEFSVDFVLENYASSGNLISSIFDLGSAATFSTISWNPSSQVPEVGNESVKFQIATNNDNSTWNFKGPDGTEDTYYTQSNYNIDDSHNGNRYLRYKLKLETADIYYSPFISDIKIGYTLTCMSPGQTYFSNLSIDTYSISVSKDGYQTYDDAVDISGYTKKVILLTPNI